MHSQSNKFDQFNTKIQMRGFQLKMETNRKSKNKKYKYNIIKKNEKCRKKCFYEKNLRQKKSWTSTSTPSSSIIQINFYISMGTFLALVVNVLVRNRMEPKLRSEILSTDVVVSLRVFSDNRRARFIGPR